MNLTLINKRRNNSIYSDEKYSYKIFRPDYSKNDVFLEAFITASVDSIGIKVPSILEVTKIDDQWAFRSNLLSGRTLYELIQENPDKTEEYLDQMVMAQTGIHKFKCPALPVQRQKFSNYIDLSDLEDTLKFDLQDMLNASPKHQKVCHGNLTPHNIVVCDDGFYITDWNHATQGNASADVARSYLWMKINMPDFADKYLEKFCEKTSTSSRYVKNWIPIVAASRLHKGAPEEAELLRKEISVIEY